MGEGGKTFYGCLVQILDLERRIILCKKEKIKKKKRNMNEYWNTKRIEWESKCKMKVKIGLLVGACRFLDVRQVSLHTSHSVGE